MSIANSLRAWCEQTRLAMAILVLSLPAFSPDARGQALANTHPANSYSAAELQKNWTGFRGFGSYGLATSATPPMRWSVKKSQNILWKATILKPGMSSPVVWQDRLFVTGADETSRDIYCLDAVSGQLLWQHAVAEIPGAPDNGKLPKVLNETGLAAPTVTTNGHFVAAIFATGELVCMNTLGERVWAKHLGTPINTYGHASSLISDKHRLYVQYDQKSNSQLIALEWATGQPVWQIKRREMSWSSPLLVDNKGRMELIVTDNKSATGIDPTTGRQLWQVDCLDGEVAPSAAYANGIVFVAVENSVASAIDISSHAERPAILWQWDAALPDSASPVAHDRYVVIPTAFGVVTCLDATTGRVFWEHEFKQGFCSSPIVVRDNVYLIDLSGIMHVFKLAATFELLSESDIGEPAYATPAFVGDRIFIRGLNHLYAISEKTD